MQAKFVLVLGVAIGCGDNQPSQPDVDVVVPDADFISVCVDGEHALFVERTTEVSLDRSYAWAIDLTTTASNLVLAEGQIFDVRYGVHLTRTWEDAWRLSGTITISNPAPFAATITGVVDRFGDTTSAVDCGVTFPYELAPGATLSCTDDFAGSSPIERGVVEVATTGCVGPASAAFRFDPREVALRETDECVGVTDSVEGWLGQACDDVTYEFTRSFGPYCCGDSGELSSTASFESNDTCLMGSDSETVAYSVPRCWIGCTLTAGYWKTHSSYGPAYFDDAWLAIGPAGSDTMFFASGKTYYDQLWTEPEGNAYDILAQAYIAAKLNALNETAWGVVETSLARAEVIFATGAERDEMIELASYLDAYNTGDIGPGPCSESSIVGQNASQISPVNTFCR